jgi:hypothetical protein
VEIQVAHIAAEHARRCHTHEGVHVGAVDVHAAAVMVHDLAEPLDLRLEHAVRARVSDHHGRQPIGILAALGFELGEIDVAVGIAAGDHDLHPHHLRARRIRAVG